MRRLVLVSAITVLLVAIVSISWAAINLNSSKSNIYREFPNGELVSATVSLSGPSETQTVYTTPGKGDFILTQLCVSPVNGGIRLAASGFGPIAHIGADPCQIFTPGVSVPKRSALTCSTTSDAISGDYFCTISGMLEP